MGEKRKRWPFDVKSERRKLKQSGIEIPPSAVPANPAEQSPNNSYSRPSPLYYEDIPFTCIDCGRVEVWTGRQQKWYFEVAKGSLHGRAVRCRACRRERAATKGKCGDPNPIKHIGSLMKRLRSAIESQLIDADFKFDGKSDFKDRYFRSAWIDYSRPGLILRCRFDGCSRRLVAETMNDEATCCIVVTTEIPRPPETSTILQAIEEFAASLREHLRTLTQSTDTIEGDVE